MQRWPIFASTNTYLETLLGKPVLPIVVLLLGLLTGCASDQTAAWVPPADGVVHDARAAITIARAVWQSMNPDAKMGSDADWQQSRMAVLHDGVWQVVYKTDPDYGLIILVSQRDGRIVDIFMGQ